MTAFCKWTARHRLLAWVLFCGVEIPVFSVSLFLLSCPPFLIGLIAGILAVFNYLFVSAAPIYLQKQPLLTLSREGDPAPLLAITEELLTYRAAETDRQQWLINHCVALREMGEISRAHELLSDINIDKCTGTLPYIKVVYYNNRSDIHRLRGEDTEAEVWSAKAMQLYRDMPNNRYKRMLDDSLKLTSADSAFFKGDSAQALQLLYEVNADDLPKQTAVALLRARILLKEGKRISAREQLEHVIGIGKGLYAVKLARELLDSPEAQDVR